MVAAEDRDSSKRPQFTAASTHEIGYVLWPSGKGGRGGIIAASTSGERKHLVGSVGAVCVGTLIWFGKPGISLVRTRWMRSYGRHLGSDCFWVVEYAGEIPEVLKDEHHAAEPYQLTQRGFWEPEDTPVLMSLFNGLSSGLDSGKPQQLQRTNKLR